jgi:hypothetical protein
MGGANGQSSLSGANNYYSGNALNSKPSKFDSMKFRPETYSSSHKQALEVTNRCPPSSRTNFMGLLPPPVMNMLIWEVPP